MIEVTPVIAPVIPEAFFRTYSPQGDGNSTFFLAGKFCDRPVFQNLFPARGRKPLLIASVLLSWVALAFFRTYSPQGDGNRPPGANGDGFCFVV